MPALAHAEGSHVSLRRCHRCRPPAVVIALEVVRDAGLPTQVPLDEPRPAAAAAEAAASGVAEQQQAQQQQQEEEAAEGEPAEPARRPIEVPGFVLACDPGVRCRAAWLHTACFACGCSGEGST